MDLQLKTHLLHGLPLERSCFTILPPNVGRFPRPISIPRVLCSLNSTRLLPSSFSDSCYRNSKPSKSTARCLTGLRISLMERLLPWEFRSGGMTITWPPLVFPMDHSGITSYLSLTSVVRLYCFSYPASSAQVAWSYDQASVHSLANPFFRSSLTYCYIWLHCKSDLSVHSTATTWQWFGSL